MSIEAMKLALEALENVQITGPDADGLLWINLPGNGTTGKAILRVGKEGLIASQCAKLFEIDRSKAITALRQAIEQAEQAQPVARVVSTAPERIWLDLGFDPEFENEVSFGDLFDVTWSRDNATGNGIEYLRADLAPPPRQPEESK
jgi:hypothetical protein